MTMKLCTVCGEPCDDGRCKDHRPVKPNATPFRQKGYSSAWDRLSRQARRLQPWCNECGDTEDLTADHLCWPATRLEHVQVLCRACNASKGGGARDIRPLPVDPHDALSGPRGLADKFTQSITEYAFREAGHGESGR